MKGTSRSTLSSDNLILAIFFHIHVWMMWGASWENWIFASAKSKAQISCAVTAQLISAFVCPTRMVQFLFYLYPKLQDSSSLLWQNRPVYVGAGRKPGRLFFSHRGSCIGGWHQNFYMSRDARKPVFGFPTRSDTNRPVQSQKQARSLKFCKWIEVALYYPSSENKGVDQLRSHCEADLCLCFCIGNNPVFSRYGS